MVCDDLKHKYERINVQQGDDEVTTVATDMAQFFGRFKPLVVPLRDIVEPFFFNRFLHFKYLRE